MPRFKLVDRIRRHPLQRLADPEERADGRRARSSARCATSTRRARVRAVRRGAHRRGRARARPGRAPRDLHRPPARTRCARGSTTRCPPTSTSGRSTRRRTASTRAMTPRRAATSIRSRGGRRRSSSPTSGGSRNRSTSARMRDAARAFVGMQNFASFSADEPGEKSTKVLVDRARDRRRRRSRPRPHRRIALSSGAWSAASSASSPRSGAAN